MAKHKAPTQVTIAPLAERSGFELFVEKYWKVGAVVAVIIAAAILGSEFTRSQEEAQTGENWKLLVGALDTKAPDSEVPDPARLAEVASKVAGTEVEPWALAFEARSLASVGRTSEARAVAERLGKSPHPLVSADGENLVAGMVDNLASLTAWKDEHPSLSAAPELPEGAPRVRLETSRGPIVVGLYSERAPKHVENFLKLCAEGYYDGTLFHRVIQGQMVQGGDPNTREGDPRTWGTGGPGYTLVPEPSDAWHFEGMLAAAATGGAARSSGSQFYLTAAPVHRWDKQYTVFGRVIEGLDLVKEMAAEAPGEGERPENPVTLASTQVL